MLTLQLSIVLLLILVNGFFAMAEIALVSARRARLQGIAADGNAGAEAALALKADPARLLATVQKGGYQLLSSMVDDQATGVSGTLNVG